MANQQALRHYTTEFPEPTVHSWTGTNA